MESFNYCAIAEVNAFRNHEDEIIKSLKSAGLKEFVGECWEVKALSRIVKESFESLDSDVPVSLSIRYLLLHVYDRLQENPRLYERLLTVLAKCGVPGKVISSVRGSYALLTSAPISTETMRLAEGISDVFSPGGDSEVTIGAKRTHQYVFEEKHISALTEILACQSNKWRCIGLSLNLSNNVLLEISSFMTTDNYLAISLSKVLYQWIVGQHEHAKAPTVENLKGALRSQTVGLGGVANQLDDDLAKHGICLNDENTSSSAKRSRPLLEVVGQSRDTAVEEEKSTLLKIDVEARHETNVSFHWTKDGLLLEEGREFIGCNKPILCLNNSWVAKGVYVCKTAIDSDLTPAVCSECINVSVSVLPLKKVLVDRYCAQPEIPEDSWPPQSSNTYINLALIKQGSIDKAGEYARNTIQGDMDDVLANKDSIEYEQVFTDLVSGTRLLIEGRPGSGKTTLVHKFSQDWGRGNCKLQLKSIKLLFLVHLRGFFNDPDITLRTILNKYYAQELQVGQIEQLSVDGNGEGLCFILDGLDEYNPPSKKKPFIFELIKRERLPNAIVIVASRPAATAKLRRIATKQVEVLGFLKTQIYEYIEKYPFSHVEKREDLHKYLKQRHNVHHMCYLPIHTAMVCYLFDVMGGKLPRTETDMYTEFTNHTLLRTLTRHEGEDDFLESASDLSGENKERFLSIIQLAFEKTIASKQVFRKSEVRSFFNDVPCGNESMGLITVDCMASRCGFENLYTFLHLTFQEYLAAYHISKLEDEKQLEIINAYCGEKHMGTVWKFYCGLVNFRKKECTLERIISLDDDLFNVNCAFESQQSVACTCAVRSGKSGTLTFTNHFLTPSDLTAIGYVVRNSVFPVEKVELDECKFGNEGINAFLEEAGEKIKSIKALTFQKNSILEQFQFINSCFQAMISLEVLCLTKIKLGVKKMKMLTKNPNLVNLKTLNLQESNINASSAEVLADYLKHCSNLQTLNLRNNNIGTNGAEALADCLKHCTNLQTLDLGHNHGICDNGAEALADGLKHCTNLQTLDLVGNNIGANSAEALADGLKHCTNLQTLDLLGNKIGANGAEALADCLKHCTNLQTLNLGFNNIGDNGAEALADGLKHCTNLQTLNLENNNIGANGAEALADGLKHCTNLQTLDLVYNNIGDNGAEALADGLKHCTNLQTLNLERNNIGDNGAEALANGLKHCTNLQTLDLKRNNIGDNGAKALANGLKHCTNLTLNLQGNNISDNGGLVISAVALANGLYIALH